VGWLKARRSSGHNPASTEVRAVRSPEAHGPFTGGLSSCHRRTEFARRNARRRAAGAGSVPRAGVKRASSRRRAGALERSRLGPRTTCSWVSGRASGGASGGASGPSVERIFLRLNVLSSGVEFCLWHSGNVWQLYPNHGVEFCLWQLPESRSCLPALLGGSGDVEDVVCCPLLERLGARRASSSCRGRGWGGTPRGPCCVAATASATLERSTGTAPRSSGAPVRCGSWQEVVRTPTPNYLRQASPDRGKYSLIRFWRGEQKVNAGGQSVNALTFPKNERGKRGKRGVRFSRGLHLSSTRLSARKMHSPISFRSIN
jgi:hypothetical protein